jgi:integrase/recombinase XerD
MTTPTNGSLLRQRMIEDMVARRMVPGTQVSHIRACKRFAAWLKRSPETATADDLRSFQLHLSQTGSAITGNRTMTGLRYLFRVTLRRLDLLPEMYFVKEPQKVPLILSQDEARRLLTMSDNVRTRCCSASATAPACVPARWFG